MYDRLFQWEKGHNSISICMIVYCNDKRDTTLSVYVWSSISMRKERQLYQYMHDRLFQLEKGHNSISICMIVYFNEKRDTTLSVFVVFIWFANKSIWEIVATRSCKIRSYLYTQGPLGDIHQYLHSLAPMLQMLMSEKVIKYKQMYRNTILKRVQKDNEYW
jgi:hypothetical protein